MEKAASPSLRPSCRVLTSLLNFLVLLLFLLLFIFNLPHLRSLTSVSPHPLFSGLRAPAARPIYSPPPPSHPPACHIIGHNRALGPALPQYNTRSLCLVSSVCVVPSTTATSLPRLHLASYPLSPTCSHLHPDLSPSTLVPAHCANLSRTHIFCAHGRFPDRPHDPLCPSIHPLSALPSSPAPRRLSPDELAVFIPPFPWLVNIFHFSFVLGHLSHVLSSLDLLLSSWTPRAHTRPRRLVLVFATRDDLPSKLGRWQRAMVQALAHHRLSAAGWHSVSVTTVAHAVRESVLEDDHTDDAERDRLTEQGKDEGEIGKPRNESVPLCASSAVFLGDRGHTALWPFANDSRVDVRGRAVPAEALALRRAVYDWAGVSAEEGSAAADELPLGVAGKFPARLRLRLPPLVMGFARRERYADPADGRLPELWRRFDDADDKWFWEMLRAEGKWFGVEVRELRPSMKLGVVEQVRWYGSVGFVVGIHGANLMNGMFVPAFGALFEVFPGGAVFDCYRSGSNSGLMYLSHEAEKASLKESFCHMGQRCARPMDYNLRRVKIDKEEHRAAVKEKVREGLRHLKKLHARFPNGIPVRLQLPEQRYVMEE